MEPADVFETLFADPKPRLTFERPSTNRRESFEAISNDFVSFQRVGTQVVFEINHQILQKNRPQTAPDFAHGCPLIRAANWIDAT
jgi:hypothetical protein